MAVIEMGDKPRHPRWVGIGFVQTLLEQGAVEVREFAIPSRVLRPIGSLRPRQLSDFNEAVQRMTPLLNSADAELLEYPDEFSRVCAAYAKKQGLKRKHVEKLAWKWLTGGKVTAAFINDLDKCGGPGKTRSFASTVGGPKQKDGPAFDELAASPYTKAQRMTLTQQAERLWRSHHNHMTRNDFWLRMREEAAKLGFARPSFAQCVNFLQGYDARVKLSSTTGLLHRRYKVVTYATQQAEADSTELQAFTKTDFDRDVRLKNPVFYKIMDARWGYVPAIYVTLEAASNAIFADLLYRALTGMASTCKKRGLPYDDADFPPLHPGQKLRVDHQELTSPKMNTALLRHLGWEVEFAIVGEGADKGAIEGTFGKDKAALKRRPEFFEKGAVGRALQAAMRATNLDLAKLEKELIKLIWDHNRREVPLARVPREFLATGRPCNRVELYKWDLDRNREVIKPIPPAWELASLLLPTDYYPVHAGMGIFISPRYYSAPELVAAGLLRKHARGATPQVEVASHRGTTDFVYWVRGPRDLVICELHSSMQDALGELTVAEADEHVASRPSAQKRERQRRVMQAAQMSAPQTRSDRKKVTEAVIKSKITKDKARRDQARKKQIAADARESATDRFGPAVPSKIPQAARRPAGTQQFDAAHADRVARLLEARKSSARGGGPT